MKAAIVQGDKERVILVASEEAILREVLHKLDRHATELNVGRIGHSEVITVDAETCDLDALICRIAEVPSPQAQPGPGPEFLRGMGPRC